MTKENPIAIFGRAITLFVRNLAIVVPGFIAAGLVAFAEIVIRPAGPSASDLQIFVTHTAVLLVKIATTVLAIAITTGMADAAWRTGRATFTDGVIAFKREGGHVFVAVLAMLVLGLLAALAAQITLNVSLVVYAYCCVYVMPSAVVGERPGFVAIAESTSIAFARPIATFVILAGVSVLAIAVASGADLIASAPYVGSIIGSLLIQAIIAYATLILVGEYRIARHMEPV